MTVISVSNFQMLGLNSLWLSSLVVMRISSPAQQSAQGMRQLKPSRRAGTFKRLCLKCIKSDIQTSPAAQNKTKNQKGAIMKSFCFLFQLISHYIFQFHCSFIVHPRLEKQHEAKYKKTFRSSDIMNIDVTILGENRCAWLKQCSKSEVLLGSFIVDDIFKITLATKENSCEVPGFNFPLVIILLFPCVTLWDTVVVTKP